MGNSSLSSIFLECDGTVSLSFHRLIFIFLLDQMLRVTLVLS
jgi:hypothetical protein